MLSRSVSGDGRCSKFVEACDCVNVGDVEVVCGAYHSSPGRRRRIRRLEAAGRGWDWRYQLSTSSSSDDAVAEWQEDRRKNMWHGIERRPAMYLTSMDIKTAFDVARPMHTAKITGDHNVHGWITAAILRETILRRYLSFSRDASVRGALKLLGFGSKGCCRICGVEPEWKKKKMGAPHGDTPRRIPEAKTQQVCGG